jgi:hypothetical protein
VLQFVGLLVQSEKFLVRIVFEGFHVGLGRSNRLTERVATLREFLDGRLCLFYFGFEALSAAFDPLAPTCLLLEVVPSLCSFVEFRLDTVYLTDQLLTDILQPVYRRFDFLTRNRCPARPAREGLVM